MSERPKATLPFIRRFPLHGWAGLAMVVLFWSLNWLLDGPRTHVYFFPLWVGYALTIDGIVLARQGSSIIARSLRRFALLFLLSAPAWWLFEFVNARTQNWTYVGAELFSDVEYAGLCTIAFSTVMPAVFETAELVRSFNWVEGMRRGPRIEASKRTATVCLAGGIASAMLIYFWPDVFYPLIWGMLFGLIEPLNIWLGRPSLFDHLEHGDWRPAVSLALGTLMCGFFWELWNMYSFPKWTYRTPGVEFLHIFEMPLLGYIGYLPFGLELYAVGHVFHGRRLNVRL